MILEPLPMCCETCMMTAATISAKRHNDSKLCNIIITTVQYRTRNQEVAHSTGTRSTASNLEQVANLLCAQANSALYLQRDGK